MFSIQPRMFLQHERNTIKAMSLEGKLHKKTQSNNYSKQLSEIPIQKKHFSSQIDTQQRILQLEQQFRTLKEQSATQRKCFYQRHAFNPCNVSESLQKGRAEDRSNMKGLSQENRKNFQTEPTSRKRLAKALPEKSQNDFYSEIPNILMNFKPKYRIDKEEMENQKPKLILKHHKDLRTSFNDFDQLSVKSVQRMNYSTNQFESNDWRRQTFTSQSILSNISNIVQQRKEGKKQFSDINNQTRFQTQTSPKMFTKSSFKNLFTSSIKLG